MPFWPGSFNRLSLTEREPISIPSSKPSSFSKRQIDVLTAGDEGGFIGALVGGVILGVIGYAKGLNAFDRVIKCPNCGVDMAVKRSHTRPFHHCPNCGSLVRLSGVGGGETPRANQNSNECPNCGYRTSFNVVRSPDKYCGNCGKRFGG